MCLLGDRFRSKAYGSAKTSSSRLAELFQSVTTSPAAITWPWSSMSVTARRPKCIAGVAQRSTSSVADSRVTFPSRSSSHWSGYCVKVCTESIMESRLVSSPPRIRL